MRVLGIETSCDETGIALVDDTAGLRAQALHSQVDLHRVYGGVVPELASRDHVRRLLPLTEQVLADAGLERTDIDGVAYTAGPGLIGAVLTGAAFGRTLAWALGVPAIAVHHMEGHLLAPCLEGELPAFPFVALLVSGGHSQLIRVAALGAYTLLGDTLDDAAGEAFDKTAKLLDLPYPGGPQIARLAERGRPGAFEFPRPMTDRPGLDFSFSGLKTKVRMTIERLRERDELSPQARADIAHAFEAAVADTLTIKCRRALRQTGARTLLIAGGVSANVTLRARLDAMVAAEGAEVRYPPLALCTDNGAMIAYAGMLRLQAGEHAPLRIDARARWPLTELAPPSAGISAE